METAFDTFQQHFKHLKVHYGHSNNTGKIKTGSFMSEIFREPSDGLNTLFKCELRVFNKQTKNAIK